MRKEIWVGDKKYWINYDQETAYEVLDTIIEWMKIPAVEQHDIDREASQLLDTIVANLLQPRYND